MVILLLLITLSIQIKPL